MIVEPRRLFSKARALAANRYPGAPSTAKALEQSTLTWTAGLNGEETMNKGGSRFPEEERTEKDDGPRKKERTKTLGRAAGRHAGDA
ncbi:hypothetical protein NDU88_006803 [Pleurodeles waltl]|uniref:Uncharacterized protein n=1 Tax=Pleurodeles waltl TaxID=8319 RepID=A0AAV7PMF5_PLEWA|nr:hypothetical protein NDU88_006803 [Pleurodeles waltl]